MTPTTVDELKSQRVWVCWLGLERDGRLAKVPMRVDGGAASVADPSSWSTHAEATNAARERHFSGVGFVFTRELGLTGVDLDHVRDPDSGAVEPWARGIVERLRSYTEISQSGTGLHVLVRGSLPPDSKRRHGRVETYDDRRFFVFTGDALPNRDDRIEARQVELEGVHDEFIERGEGQEMGAGDLRPLGPFSDSEVHEMAFAAKNAPKIKRLWEADDTGYGSTSEADQAFVNLLAYYSRDPEQLDRLFRASKRNRPKWDERPDYRRRTIDNALRLVRPRTLESDEGTRYLDDEEALRNHVFTLIATRQRSKATELLARFVEFQHALRTVRSDDNPETWVYQDGVYVPNGRTHVTETCRRVLGEAFTTAIANEVVAKVEADTYVDQAEFFNAPDQYPTLVPVRNGVLDVVTRELLPFDARRVFFHKLPVAYDASANCPHVNCFLASVFATTEDLTVFLEFAGSSIVRDYTYEKSLMLVGTGRNGKSKTLELLKTVLGEEACASVSLQRLEEDRFAAAGLFHKLVNIVNDLPSATLKSTSTFKAVTGRDTISADRKFKTDVYFKSYAKMVFATNQLPRTVDDSFAFFERWILIEFPFRFIPQAELDELKPEERVGVKPQDARILETMTTPRELSGFLNLMLDGYARLSRQRGFSTSGTEAARRRDWQRRSNSFAAFMEDCLEKGDPDEEIVKTHLHQEYSEYCHEHGVKPMSDRVIKFTLGDEWGVTDVQSRSNDRQRAWVGVRWKEGFVRIRRFKKDHGSKDDFDDEVSL